MSLIATRNLTLRIGGQTVLRDVDIAVERGEIVTIVGPNGSGKSSLLRALIGALKPASGTITRAADLRIGYVPQKLRIDATLPLTVHGFLNLPRRQPRETIAQALLQVLTPLFDRRRATVIAPGAAPSRPSRR